MLKVLGKEEIIELLKKEYGEDCIIELYIDYNDEGVEGNDQIIAEVNTAEDMQEGIVVGSSFDFLFEESNNAFNEEYKDFIKKSIR